MCTSWSLLPSFFPSLTIPACLQCGLLPHTYIHPHTIHVNRKLSFNLRLNSVAGGCDSPSYLDHGVRLEVRKPGGVWEPVRFYTSTTEVSPNSLVTMVSNDTHVVDENNSLFPLYENQSNQPFTITEYFCGREYYTPETEYQWLQRFNGPTMQDMETWSLSDVSIVYFESNIHCYSQLTESVYLDYNGSSLNSARWTVPACEQESSSQPLAVYFNEPSVVDGLTQRGVVIRPQWWNAHCSPRTMEGMYNFVHCCRLIEDVIGFLSYW